MRKAIWSVERDRFCLICAIDLDSIKGGDYVMRCHGNIGKGKCARCGSERQTMEYSYTMCGKALRRIGRENG